MNLSPFLNERRFRERFHGSCAPPTMGAVMALLISLFALSVPTIEAQSGPPPTWTRDIAPIFKNRCQDCHRPGDRYAPMSLMSYGEVRPYVKAIRARVHRKEMPPWAAAPMDRPYLHDRSLPQDELDLVLRWIEARAPMGPGPEPAPEPKPVSTWEIGEPDLTLDMGVDFNVPAQGPFPTQFFPVNLKLEKESWLSAIELRPGNPAVVREIVLYVQNPPGGTPVPEAGQFGEGYLGCFAKGRTWTVFEPGEGKLLKPGARLVFQVLYVPNGQPATDRSVAALKFHSAPEVRQIVTRGIGETQFAIPQHVAEFPVQAVYKFPADAEIWRLRPEMHYRGQDFKFIAHYPDGRNEVLLHVDRYNYDWQEYYYPAERIPIPAGTVIECAALMDNSHENPRNPEPHETVVFGDQPMDEKMIGWIDYVLK